MGLLIAIFVYGFLVAIASYDSSLGKGDVGSLYK